MNPDELNEGQVARIRSMAIRMREMGKPQAEVDAFMQRAITRMQTSAAEMADAQKMTGGERAANAFRTAYQGASLNLGDELMGAVRGLPQAIAQRSMDPIRTSIQTERDELSRFREENPRTAFGLELAGGAATGVGLGRAALAGAPTAGRVAARVAASGAGGGALAGFGAGETPTGRAVGAGLGAAGGALLGGLFSAGAKAFPNSVAGGQQLTDDLMGEGVRNALMPKVRTGVPTGTTTAAAQAVGAEASRTFSDGVGTSESALRATARAFGGPENIPSARARVRAMEQAGMGDEMLAMNAGGYNAARAARAAANLPNSDAGQIVNDRLARQGGRLGEQVPDDLAVSTGFTDQISDPVAGRTRYKYPEENLDDMQRALREKVDAGYEAFRALPEVPLDPSDEAQRMFIERYVQPVIENRRLTGQLSGASALSGETVDAAFKNLQREIRGAQAAVGMGNRNVASVQTLEAMRDRVLAAIGQTDPNYAQLGRTYAMDDEVGKGVQEAFESGRSIRTPGSAIVARRGTASNPSADRALRAGNVAQMQESASGGASNADLAEFAKFRDVARAAIGSPRARDTFIQMHGREAYDALLKRLLPKIEAAAQNAVARGNSTTARQLLETMALGDDAALDLFGEMATQGPQRALTDGLIRGGYGRLEQARRLGVGRVAGETADLLTTRGATRTKTLLDLLQELGQRDQTSRTIGGVAGSTVAGRVPNRR